MHRTSLPLSERDVALLQALVNCKTNAQIAEEMALTQQTVKNYLGRVYQQIGVRSRSEAAAWALAHGVLQPPDDAPTAQATVAAAEITRIERTPIPSPLPPHIAAQTTSQPHTLRPRRPNWRVRSIVIAALFVATAVAALFWATTATYGRSTLAIPVSSGKVEAVEAYLRDRYGDDYSHWIEQVEVAYADGTVRQESEAFFSFPSTFLPLANGKLTDIVTGRAGSGPYRAEFWRRFLDAAPPKAHDLALQEKDLPPGSRIATNGYASIADSGHPLHVRDLPDSPGLVRMRDTPFLYNYKDVFQFTAFRSDAVMVGNFIYAYPDANNARTVLNHFERQLLDAGAAYAGTATSDSAIVGTLYHLAGSEGDHVDWFIGTFDTLLFLAVTNGFDQPSTREALVSALDLDID